MTWHRFVRLHQVEDYLRLGWIPEPTLDTTPHGFWSVHMRWLCGCRVVEPK